jgi:hypothetical protein
MSVRYKKPDRGTSECQHGRSPALAIVVPPSERKKRRRREDDLTITVSPSGEPQYQPLCHADSGWEHPQLRMARFAV